MKRIITISREFGSGGRSIGRLVAEKLGYQFYDSEIVNKVAERSGFAPEFIEESGEYASARSSLLFAIATANQYTVDGLSMHDKLYIEQTRIIEELAQEGNCVIVGRCADYILRDYKPSLDIFIQCEDLNTRIHRVMRRNNITESEARERIKMTDKCRSTYYSFYTGTKWGKRENHDLIIDTHHIGIEASAELIALYAKGYCEKLEL